MKKAWIAGLVMCCLVLLSGCGTKKEEKADTGTYVYYLNTEENKIMSVGYKIKEKTKEAQVEELWNEFSKKPTEGMQNAFPEDVLLLSYKIDENRLLFYFNKGYQNMNDTREVLARASLVRTMVQIEGIDFIIFYVGDTPLRDAKNNYVGAMTKDSFVENVGQQINSIGEQNYNVYLATMDGKKLKEVERKIHTLSNSSSEKMIIEQLMEAKSDEDCQPTIPGGTNLISASTVDGVCFVVFDEGFLKQNYSIQEDVIIYSIVNSLCELSTVNKVQISIKGQTGTLYRDDFSLDELYERNLDLVENEKK